MALLVLFAAYVTPDAKAATSEAPHVDRLLTPSMIGRLQLGAPASRVARLFGTPTNEQDFARCPISISPNPLRLSRYKRRKGSVTLRIDRARGVVDGYLTTSPTFVTARRVGVGDKKRQLFAAYGQTLRPLQEAPVPGGGASPNIWIVASGPAEGMAFELDGGEVAAISAAVADIGTWEGRVSIVGGGASPLCFERVFLESQSSAPTSGEPDSALWNLLVIACVVSGAILITLGAVRRSTACLLAGALLLSLGMIDAGFYGLGCLDEGTQSCHWYGDREGLWPLAIAAYGTTLLGALCARLDAGDLGRGGRYLAWISAWTVAIFVCYIVIGIWIEPETYI